MRAAANSIANEYEKSIFDNLETNPGDFREDTEVLERQLKDVQEELFKTKVLLTESRTQVAIWNSGTQTSRVKYSPIAVINSRKTSNYHHEVLRQFVTRNRLAHIVVTLRSNSARLC